MTGRDFSLPIAQRYFPIRLLGRGAVGDVWLCRVLQTESAQVAVKCLRVEEPSAREQFERELRVLSLLVHPRIVRVLEHGVWEGRPYIVMEYATKGSLHDWIEQHLTVRRLPELSEAWRLFLQVCEGVSVGHSLRVPGPAVHRDLKPSNVLLEEIASGLLEVRVADFGVARLGPRGRTASGDTIGTAPYMAPEQALGRASHIGTWTDVFALGVLGVELLTLRNAPARGRWWWTIALQDARSLRTHLQALRADVPQPVWEFFALLLQSESTRRPVDATAVWKLALGL